MSKNNSNTKDDIYSGGLLPSCLKLSDIVQQIRDTDTHYTKALERMRILDGTDRGKLWKVIKAQFPKYQLTPDTNWVNYIKENIVASIYTTGRYATLLPKSSDDVNFCLEFNSALDTIWDGIEAERYQFLAGERAALLNLGVTQVGWRQDLIGGTKDHWYQGNVVFKNIDPMKFRRDPYADDLENADFCYYFDDYSLNLIMSKDIYKARIKEIIKMKGKDFSSNPQNDVIKAATDRNTSDRSAKNYHKLTYYYTFYHESKGKDKKTGEYTVERKLAEIHILDDAYVLYVKPDLKPKMYPFAMLYCNNPAGDLIGASEPAKIFSNNLVYNLLNSIYATYAYKAQRPPRFVNVQSGINLRQFAKYGNDADKTFPVRSDASQAVHYAQFPPLPPELLQVHQNIKGDIQAASGIDAVYAGKQSNSVQTTGGMDSLLAQTTQRDNQKIMLYENYSKRLTELVVLNLIEHGDKRVYTVNDPMSGKVSEVTLDFPQVDDDIRFRYTLDIQTYLPRNKQRVAATANMLLEKQAQYQPNPEIITVEEWLLMQDIPFKDMIFKRMGLQRNIRMSEQVAKSIEMYATLVQGGVDPDQAVDAIADTLIQDQQGQNLGNTGMAGGLPGAPMGGTPQAAQQGNANSQTGMDISSMM